MTRALLQQSLDALGKAERQVVYADVAPHGCISEAIKALRAALAQPEPEPEPYGWMVKGVPTVVRGSLAEAIQKREAQHIGGDCVAFPVYTRPAKPLTDEQVDDVLRDHYPCESYGDHYRLVKAAHGIRPAPEVRRARPDDTEGGEI